jgi:hypothetical protein
MSIIIEVKSNKECCRENKTVLTEQQLNTIMKFLKGEEGGKTGESFRTLAARSIVDSILSRMVPELKDNRVLYRGLVNTLAAIDLDDVMALTGISGNKPKTCKRISEIVVQGLENTLVELVATAVTEKIRELAPEGDADSPFTKLLGDTIRSLASAGNLTAQLAAGIFTEDIKGSLTDNISDFICDIDFGDIAKASFGDLGDLAVAGGEELVDAFKGLFNE